MITCPKTFTLKSGSTLKTSSTGSHSQVQPIINLSLNANFHHHLHLHLRNRHLCSSSSSSSLINPSFLRKNPYSSPPMALSLSRPKHKSLTNPSLIRLFSSSSSTTPPPNDHSAPQSSTNSEPQEQQQNQVPSFSSYFSDIKASLRRQQQQQQQQQQNKFKFNPSGKPASTNQSFSKPTSKVSSLEEIKKNLSEYRLRSSVPPPAEPNPALQSPPPSSSSTQQVSFQELYKRNVLAKSENRNVSTQSSLSSIQSNKPISGKFSFDAIRESLRQMGAKSAASTRGGGGGGDVMSISGLKSSLRLKPITESEPALGKSTAIGGTEGLPVAVFGKEMKEEEGSGVKREATSTEFVKMYSYGELGEKLRILRPEVKEEKGKVGWFSLEELNERLVKLREMEERETESRIGGVLYKDIRESLLRLKMSDDEKAKKSSVQRLGLLSQLGATPNFMLHPPKEHLVEKYFHPDNMSASEKLKIELAKVRDEFKMSESDCGSSRVQVAQLTTKIKHLSSVLHKKDKHSQRGLQAMVQKRKKLLKYLRRTDWDSYCFVISKLGLRDNPDYKN